MPIPVISIAQMREWEKATWDAGQTEAEVIRRVGKAVARQALKMTRAGERILILAGKGHNGDDARGAQSHLPDRVVELLRVADPEADEPRLDANLSSPPALVIDGLFGIGVNRPLAPPWANFIRRLNTARRPVLAVDTPSGLNADTGEIQGAAVEATVTLTVGAPKRGLLTKTAWPHVGRLEIADNVGLVSCPHTSDLNWMIASDFADFPPTRPVAGHKGTFGHLGIVAGSFGFHGAAVLTARGAQRAQPGLITLFIQEPAYHPVAAQLQAVMVHPWTTQIQLPAKCSGILIGPGLAAANLPDNASRLTQQLWREATIPVVVDASALDWLPPDTSTGKALRLITPHPGEAARLLKMSPGEVQADRPRAVREVSRRFGDCWVALKGHQTLVGRSSGPVFVNSSGNPHLGQGGAGDLLSGYLAGLVSQPAFQADPAQAICFGVWQHGAAADWLQASKSNWIVEDLSEILGSVS